MDVELDFKLSLEQNAALYYEKSKKAKKKLDGAIKALNESKGELGMLEREKEKIMNQIEKELEKEADDEKKKEERKTYWYDKFRWFFCSNGMLAVGGRDDTSNDIIIKKHIEKDDLVFHTDAPGSPFFLLKKGTENVSVEVLGEVAIATASFSRAWKLGLGSAEVFYVTPLQVSKEAESGEYMKKGAFMIRGKREYVHPNIGLAVGMLKDGRLMCGPSSAVKANCEKYVIVLQGDEKKLDFGKKIIHKLVGGSEEEIMHILPAGEFRFG